MYGILISYFICICWILALKGGTDPKKQMDSLQQSPPLEIKEGVTGHLLIY